MYVPLPYQEMRREVLLAAIEARSFGTLISAGAGEVQLSHLPFVLHGDAGEELLVAHLARSNPQWRDLAAGTEAVASFLVDDGYISPGWYPSKAENGRVVPTWNYIAVEVRGRAEVVETGPELLEFIDLLTARHEQGRATPWSTADAPTEFTAALLGGIVGVRLRIAELTGVWKLDQQKRADDRAGAARGLAEEARTRALAIRMGLGG